MADERQIAIEAEAAFRAGKLIANAGQDIEDVRRDVGRLIQSLSAGPPWSMDKIGKQVEVGDGAENKGYRINEQEVLKAWDSVAAALEALGINVQNAVAKVVDADVVSGIAVDSTRQPNVNTSRRV